MSDFKAECTRFNFCWRSAPDTDGGAARLPSCI